jgi:uncharacterized RDD family membrane protein YckC
MDRRAGPFNGLGLRRAGAMTGDLLLAGVLGIVVMLPFGWHPGMHYDAVERLVSAVGDAAVFGLCVVPFLVRDGTTPGKRLAGLRVVMARDGELPSVRVAVLRDPVLKVLLFGSLASVIHPLLDVVTLAIDLAPAFYFYDGRTLHDRLAGTTVVGDY